MDWTSGEETLSAGDRALPQRIGRNLRVGRFGMKDVGAIFFHFGPIVVFGRE
jgi:hypothetical protein